MAKQMTDSSSTPTHEQITRRAYEIFIERGQPEGRDLDHWLEAEKQLRAAGQSDEDTQEAAHIRNPQGNGRSQNGGRLQTQTRARK
jgi:hypothetical protein